MFYDFYRKDGKLFFYKWDTLSFFRVHSISSLHF